MPYSEKVLAHVQNPHNVGGLDKSDPSVGTGGVGTPESGLMVKIQIKADPTTRRIVEARFKVFGCSAAIACGSLLTDRVQDRALDQARQIQSAQIAAELELSADRFYCAEQAIQALQAALRDWEEKQTHQACSATG